MKLTDEKILAIAMHVAPFCPCSDDEYLIAFARAILKEAGVEELERDAERYRWLRDDNATEFGEPWAITRFEPGDERNTDGGTCSLTGKELDRAIDEAMKAK